MLWDQASVYPRPYPVGGGRILLGGFSCCSSSSCCWAKGINVFWNPPAGLWAAMANQKTLCSAQNVHGVQRSEKRQKQNLFEFQRHSDPAPIFFSSTVASRSTLGRSLPIFLSWRHDRLPWQQKMARELSCSAPDLTLARSRSRVQRLLSGFIKFVLHPFVFFEQVVCKVFT